MRFDDENLAVRQAVPVRLARGAETEPVADDCLEVVAHQPLSDQRPLGESTPDLLRRMRHFPFDDDGTRLGGEVVQDRLLYESITANSVKNRTICESFRLIAAVCLALPDPPQAEFGRWRGPFRCRDS